MDTILANLGGRQEWVLGGRLRLAMAAMRNERESNHHILWGYVIAASVPNASFSSLGCARCAWLDRAHHRHESEGFPHRHQLWRGRHQPGHVLVVDAQGDTNNAVIGELVKPYAQQRGCVGFVIDGAIRDVASFDNTPCYARSVVHCGPYKSGPRLRQVLLPTHW